MCSRWGSDPSSGNLLDFPLILGAGKRVSDADNGKTMLKLVEQETYSHGIQFTSSTSFANPAVTLGRMVSYTFAGIAPSAVPAFVVAHAVGAVIGSTLVLAPYPLRRPRLTHIKESPMSDRPPVLFVCVHNAGRSQMAAAFPAVARRRTHRGPAMPSTRSPSRPWPRSASTSLASNPRS